MVRVPVNFSDLGRNACTLSKALLVPHFSSAIPSDKAPGAHYASFLVAVLTDNIINSKSKSLTPLRAILSYYEASYRTTITTLAVRKAFVLAQQLTDVNGDWKQEFALLQEAASIVLATIRPDPDTQNVLHQLAIMQ